MGKTLRLGRTSMPYIRMDEKMKTEGIAAMGLTAAAAMRLLFHRIVADQAFPWSWRCPTPRPAPPWRGSMRFSRAAEIESAMA
jgi:antitoxin component of RelBE/YafQ-DinJ toxin-antitoxin module